MSDETVQIPLRNRKKEIVGHAIISKEDEERVKKHKWHLIKSKKHNKLYVATIINRIPIRLHQFILGKASKDTVIDHINGDGLYNTRINLRYASFSLNAQNRLKKKGTSSKYIGVSKTKNSKYYKVSYKNIYYGRFIEEIEAAKIYDSIALILSNGIAKTNNIVTYIEVKDKTINDIVSIKRIKPLNIKWRFNSYYVKISYKRKIFTKYGIKTLTEAKQYLQNFKQEITILKEIEKQRILNLPIVRNDNNIAIIYAYNNKNEIVGEALVDDDKWHELYEINWSLSNDYFINNKIKSMHRYLMNATKNDPLVDHINHNPLDNRLTNLRFNTYAGNTHNKTKIENTTSKYYGVYWHDTIQYWIAGFKKDTIYYYVGNYDTQEKAAAAYNVKAREVYKEFANLNILENEQELLELIKQKKKEGSSIYRGVTYCKVTNKWKARIYYKNKQYHLGLYHTAIEAAVACNVKVRELCPLQIKRINIIENEKEILELTENREKQTSIYRGVCFKKDRKTYEAYITYNNKRYGLGHFAKEIDAARAYNDKAFELYGKDYKHFNVI